jgi:phospholipid/cholesterol/gamma-HCH transport system substrate-binding protein
MTGKVVWADQDTSAKIAYDGGAAQLFGDDSWKWMLLQPSLAEKQE